MLKWLGRLRKAPLPRERLDSPWFIWYNKDSKDSKGQENMTKRTLNWVDCGDNYVLRCSCANGLMIPLHIFVDEVTCDYCGTSYPMAEVLEKIREKT